MSKKEDRKPFFRDVAKRAAYEYLESLLYKAQRALNENKSKINTLNNEQKILKANIAGVHQVIQEFKK